jgi:hypothetical protein
MKNIALVAILLGLCSCDNSQQDRKIRELLNYKDSVLKADKESRSIVVRNLKSQFQDYFTATINQDFETVKKYINPDLYEYIKQKFPERKMSISQIMEKVLRNLHEKNKAFTYNKKAEVELYKITKKYSDDNSMFYSFISLLHMKLDGDHLYNGEEILAMSSDKGANWTFVVFNREDIPKVLKRRYSKIIIDAVMYE